MDWAEFIKETARQKLPSEKHRLTFIDIFGDNESQKIDKTIEGHLREIYKRFEGACPKLTKPNKGKKEILREYLQDLYSKKDGGISYDLSQPLTNPQNIPTAEPIPELTTLEFIGRDRDLTNLASFRNQYKIVLIKAGAGVGKSTLAREFLQTRFKKVIRIEMGLESGNVTPAEEKVSQILRKDFDEEPSRDFGINLDILREKLADRANPIGVLIDNLEPALDENYRFREKLRGYDALLAVLGDRDVFSFTLITSRRSLTTLRAKVHEYLLDGLDITAWRQYFHDCENGADSEALLQMRNAYNGNAKVMDILHGAIKNRFDGNIGAYWNRYKDALLADSELETLISVEMDWLRDNQLDAYKLLCRMGCYRYQDVKTVPFEGLICLLWDVPESRRTCIVNYLSKTSLIEVKCKYYLHPAVRENSKSRLLQNNIDWETANRNAAEFWTNDVKNIENINDGLRAFEAYYHAIEIPDMSLAAQVIIKERYNNLSNNSPPLGKSFYRLGLLEIGIRSIESIVNANMEPNVLCLLLNILGDLYWLIGKVRKALEYHNTSKELAIKGKIQLQEKLALFNMALCYFDLWELDLCIDLCQLALLINNKDGDPENLIGTHTCCSLMLSWVYSLQEIQRISEADILVKETLNIFPQVCFLEWGRCYSLFFFGGYFLNKRDLNASYQMYNQMLEIAKESNYKQAKAKALTGIGIIRRMQNQLTESVQIFYQAIDLLVELNAKIDLAEAYFQLGLTYQAMGEHDQVEEYKAKALELFAQMEAPKQIERVNKAFGGNIQ